MDGEMKFYAILLLFGVISIQCVDLVDSDSGYVGDVKNYATLSDNPDFKEYLKNADYAPTIRNKVSLEPAKQVASDIRDLIKVFFPEMYKERHTEKLPLSVHLIHPKRNRYGENVVYGVRAAKNRFEQEVSKNQKPRNIVGLSDKMINLRVVKLYGAIHNRIVNVDVSKKINMVMSAKKIGPKVFGHFQNGMVMEYLEGLPLTPTYFAVGKYIPVYTEAIVRMHKVSIPEILRDEHEANIWKTLKDWIKLGKQLSVDVGEIEKELEELESELNTETYNNGNIVLCHNDIQAANVIYFDAEFSEDGKNSARLLDFEYAGLNNRYYDIASVLVERARSKEGFPRVLEVIKYVSLYYQLLEKIESSESKNENVEGDSSADSSDGLSECEVKQESAKVEKYTLVVVLRQIIWYQNTIAIEPDHSVNPTMKKLIEGLWKFYQVHKKNFFSIPLENCDK